MEPARKFKIIVNSKECGTCSGATPSAVAKKVVKKLCGTSSKVVKFSLKECKRGCERECGPYQGRMEKLDRPYKRDGKKITHRVVCGKVKKMRGGREFDESITSMFNDIPRNLKHEYDDSSVIDASDVFKFKKDSDTDTDLKYKIENGTTYLFLGTVTIAGYDYYRYIITYNFNHRSMEKMVPMRKMVPISQNKYIDITEIEQKQYEFLPTNLLTIYSELVKNFNKDLEETIKSIPLEQREVIAKSIYINNNYNTYNAAHFMRIILNVKKNNNIDEIIKKKQQ